MVLLLLRPLRSVRASVDGFDSHKHVQLNGGVMVPDRSALRWSTALGPLPSAMASIEGFDGAFAPSHVNFSGGLPKEFKFHVADGEQCTGCTRCADVAQKTCLQESESGKRRVFRQHGDSVDVIKEAIATAVVKDSIGHSLSW